MLVVYIQAKSELVLIADSPVKHAQTIKYRAANLLSPYDPARLNSKKFEKRISPLKLEFALELLPLASLREAF